MLVRCFYDRSLDWSKYSGSRLSLHFRLAEARKDALASVDLMRARYSRIVADEMSKNGLVILLALYGRLLSGKKQIHDFYILGGCVAQRKHSLPAGLGLNIKKKGFRDF